MPKSKYEDIYQNLKEKIESGEYEYEALLPSENELVQVYDCSRNTLRRAIAKLTGMGYTQPMHGRGVRVIYTPQKQHDFDIASLSGLCQAGLEHGYAVLNQVITFTDMTVDERLAKKTSFEKDTEVYFIQRLRSIDGVPKMIDNTLLRKDLVPGLTEKKLEGSLFQYIENEVGMTIKTVKRRVTIERITPFDEKYLTLDGYNCLAVITSHVFNADGIQFEYTESRNRPDLFAFNTVVTRENI